MAPANEDAPTKDQRHQRAVFAVIVSALSIAALFWVMGPAVGVEVELDDADALRGWLSTRLLEEGYDLAPDPGAADATIFVSSHADGLAVQVAGDGTRSFAVEAGPAAVERLEVLHRALQGVEATLPVSLPPHSEAGMAVHFSGSQHDGLLAAVTHEARGHGVAVRAVPGTDDTLVCIAVRGTLAEIALGSAADGCGPVDSVVAVGTKDAQARAAAALLQRIGVQRIGVQRTGSERTSTQTETIALAELLGEDALSAPVPDPTDVSPAFVPAQDDGTLPPMHGPPRAELRVAAEWGIMVRGAIDAAARGRVRVGRLRGIGARMELGVVPSPSARLRVVDTFLMVGPDWELELGSRLYLSLGALAGTDVHTYATDGRVAAEVGWALAAPIGASLAVGGQTRVHVMAHPGLSGVDTDHVFRNIPGWRRTSWRVGVAVGISYGWRIE